jgi:hypothetical protein
MPKLILFSLVFIGGECAAYFIFPLVKRIFSEKWQWRIDLQVTKGWLERLFLFLCLVYNLPHALIAFGAIKIGTRVNDRENKISNDYFFVGNMVSLLLVVLFYVIWLRFKK